MLDDGESVTTVQAAGKPNRGQRKKTTDAATTRTVMNNAYSHTSATVHGRVKP